MSLDEEDSVSSITYDKKLKIMVVGESLVGKTSLIRRYTKNKFGGDYLATIGIDFQFKYLDINGKKVKVELWDTAGQERFKSIAKTYFQSSDGLLIVYDITCRNSFSKLDDWFEQIRLNAPENSKLMLVGNKKDIEKKREVSMEEGLNFANQNNVKFYETSAKDGTNVNSVFELLAQEIISDEEIIKTRNKRSSQVLKKKNIKPEKKACC